MYQAFRSHSNGNPLSHTILVEIDSPRESIEKRKRKYTNPIRLALKYRKMLKKSNDSKHALAEKLEVRGGKSYAVS
jgi:hypothetical protein